MIFQVRSPLASFQPSSLDHTTNQNLLSGTSNEAKMDLDHAHFHRAPSHRHQRNFFRQKQNGPEATLNRYCGGFKKRGPSIRARSLKHSCNSKGERSTYVAYELAEVGQGQAEREIVSILCGPQGSLLLCEFIQNSWRIEFQFSASR